MASARRPRAAASWDGDKNLNPALKCWFLYLEAGATIRRTPSPAQQKVQLDHRTAWHHVYALETTGVLIIAATLLGITLVRFWQAIHWSWR